jgi:hypothetical protein
MELDKAMKALYLDVQALMGGECLCGGDGIECTDDCCPPDAGDGICQKETLADLKRVLAQHQKVELKGWVLESVGTYIRSDGWTFPMTADGGYDDDEGVAINISDCDSDGEGYEWWQSLSDNDRKIAEAVLRSKNNHE